MHPHRPFVHLCGCVCLYVLFHFFPSFDFAVPEFFAFFSRAYTHTRTYTHTCTPSNEISTAFGYQSGAVKLSPVFRVHFPRFYFVLFSLALSLSSGTLPEPIIDTPKRVCGGVAGFRFHVECGSASFQSARLQRAPLTPTVLKCTATGG